MSNLPTVTNLSPKGGSVSGGETVTVTGTNFTDANVVKFGSVKGNRLVVNSDSSITIVAPAQSAATVDVTVTDDAGTSVLNGSDRYTYA